MATLTRNQQLLDLASFGSTTGIADPTAGDPGGYVGHAQGGLRIIEQKLQDFRSNVSQLRNSSHLTPEGVKARVGDLGARTISDSAIVAMRDVFLAKAKQKLATLDDALRDDITNRGNTNEAAEAIAMMEVRMAISAAVGDDGLSAEMVVNEAIENGDVLTFRAMTEAPRSIALLTQNQIDNAREKFFAGQASEIARQRVELRRAVETLESRINQFIATVSEEAGLQQADPIRDQAAGDVA